MTSSSTHDKLQRMRADMPSAATVTFRSSSSIAFRAVNGRPQDTNSQHAVHPVLVGLQDLFLCHLHFCHKLDGETVFVASTPKPVKPLPLHKP